MAQFASLDGTAMCGTDVNDFTADPNSLTRRSISIFSRRGTETPEPRPPFIAQAGMAPPNTKKSMTSKQQSWIRRKSIGRSKKTSGTILNAVPEAARIEMTALEEQMATSPNEEIVSAIGTDASPTQRGLSTSSVQTTPTQQMGFWAAKQPSPFSSPNSSPKSARRKKRHDTNNRIGVWVDGIVQWDDEPRTERNASVRSQMIAEHTGMTPVRSVPVKAGKVLGIGRPSLSVMIPGQEPLVNDLTLSTLVLPKAQRPILSVAPASIVSRFSSSPPAITTTDSAGDVSPMDEESAYPPTPPVVSDRPKSQRESSSSTASTVDRDRDDVSVYSKRSSATSIEANPQVPQITKAEEEKRPFSLWSIGNPAEQGVFDNEVNINKPLPAVPDSRRKTLPANIPPPPPTPATSTKRRNNRSKSTRSTKSAPGGRKSDKLRVPKSMKPARSLTQLDAFDKEFMRSSPYASSVAATETDLSDASPATPTLSQVEQDLVDQLSIMEVGGSALRADQVPLPPSTTASRSSTTHRTGSVRSVMQPPERVPTVPKKSRKREWRRSSNMKDVVHIAHLAINKGPNRRRSESNIALHASEESDKPQLTHVRKTSSLSELREMLHFAQHLRTASQGVRDTVIVPLPPQRGIVYDDGLCVVEGPNTVADIAEEDVAELPAADTAEDAAAIEAATSSVKAAEGVLLHILASLHNLEDLRNTAVINKGMHRVYKENEMHLIHTVTLNQSPAAWEYREWSPPERKEVDSSKASSQLEHTPKSYLYCHQRDQAVIESLKTLILEHCQTFIRRETAFALSTPRHPNAQRFNDAFWRIWCFCKIFGHDKEREDDVTGQLDWLKGGLLANNQAFSATVGASLDYDMNSVLLNPPEHFSKGNAGGLAGQQLYDMTEIWTCMTALLSGFQGRPEQAASHGVFENCDIGEGDIEQQEIMLEEWTSYVMTLGPAVVLEMAQYASDDSPAGFALAKENGWTNWTPATSTRTTFLKEPVSRLYEERVAAAAAALQNPKAQEKKENSRKRVANLAAEIRLRRQTSGFKRQPFIDMYHERPMSMLSRQGSMVSVRSNLTTSSYATAQSNTHPAFRSLSPAPPLPTGNNLLAVHTRTPSGQLIPPRKISPIIEDRVESFNKMALQNFEGLADDTAARAIKKIVDMGFTCDQAKEALRVTDMGDGLRIDRAVDLLLRQR